ncbi:MAG: branched-chain amino acid aminotransferase [Alphaproteobacteria bacterium]|nr:branched-chain amino acid aminotransferase [Alphaproteobacteria bacterium]
MVQAWTYVEGRWLEGNPPLMGPMTHALWLSTLVFDGARAFEGVAPDLDLHCARAVRSASSAGLKAPVTEGEILELCRDGISKFSKQTALYIRPMFFAEDGEIQPNPASTRFALSVYEAPLPPPTGFTVCLSPFRRPSPESAMTDAKAACLYPNVGRCLKDATSRGFDNCVVLDPIGNVAEFATSNLFFVKDGVVHTPAPNGTFLAGITRSRVIGLLRNAGLQVHERTIKFADVQDADEVFSTGNYSKVVPITRVEQRNLQPGPVFKRARELYWEFAHKS